MLPRYTGAGNSNGRLHRFFKMPRHYKLQLVDLEKTVLLMMKCSLKMDR